LRDFGAAALSETAREGGKLVVFRVQSLYQGNDSYGPDTPDKTIDLYVQPVVC